MTTQADWELLTERTSVRPVAAGDAAAIHASRSQMPFDPPTRNLVQTRRMIAAMRRRRALDASGWQQFVVRARTSGAFLGDIGINFDEPRRRQAEIGFAFAPEARGHGFAGEAAAALVERLFATGRHRLVAQTDLRNLAAQRLLERLGFRREGLLRQSWEDGGRYYDELIYARLASD